MLHNHLPFLPTRIKNGKAEMLLVDLDHEKEFGMHIINLEQKWNHGIVLKKCTESLNSIKNLG